MKHLHLQFIAASCGLGLGVFMLILMAWQAQALGPGVTAGVAFPPMIDLLVGSVLVGFGGYGIRLELGRYGR